MLDQGALLLPGAGHEAGHVDEGDQGNVEGVAEAHEPGPLARRIDVQHPGQDLGLIGDDTDDLAVQPAKAAEDVLGEIGADLEEVGLVHDLEDQLLHVVGLVRIGRDQAVERALLAIGLVEAFAHRRLFPVGQGQKVDQPAHLGQGFEIVLEGAVGYARLDRVYAIAA